MEFNRLQQNSSSHHSNSSNSININNNSIRPQHLPDENDIEKLFPKCQPKRQSQQTQRQQQQQQHRTRSNGGRYHDQQSSLHQRNPNQQQQFHTQQQHRRQLRSSHNKSNQQFQAASRELKARPPTNKFDPVDTTGASGNNNSDSRALKETPIYFKEARPSRMLYFDSSDSFDEQPPKEVNNNGSGFKRSATSSAIRESQRLGATNDSYSSSSQNLFPAKTSNNNNKANLEQYSIHSSRQRSDSTGGASVPFNASGSAPRPQRANRRHHIASKSLQQQLQRSQFAQDQPVNHVPLINLSSTEINSNETNHNNNNNNNNNKPTQPELNSANDNRALDQQTTADPARRCNSSAEKRQSAATSAAPDAGPSSRKLEKGINRTRRGIVFLDRGDFGTNDHTNQQQQAPSLSRDQANKIASSEEATLAAAVADNSVYERRNSAPERADRLTATTATKAQGSAPLPLAHAATTSPELDRAKTADAAATVLQDKLVVDDKLAFVTDQRQTISEPVTGDHTQQLQYNPKSNHQFQPGQLSEPQDAAAGVDDTLKDETQNDDDKYINLFVYDNSPDQATDKEPVDSQENHRPQESGADDDVNGYHAQDNDDDDGNDDVDDRNNANESVSSLRHTGHHQLLTVDHDPFDNDEVVRNDTSTEELCNVDDTDKQKLIDLKAARKSSDSEPVNLSLLPETDISSPVVPVKPIVRHQRSLGTLQTVDEKSEINTDEETANPDRVNSPSGVSHCSAISVAMKSGSNQYKKGIFPPGFPQRIKPLEISADDTLSCRSSPSPTSTGLDGLQPALHHSPVTGRTEFLNSNDSSTTNVHPSPSQPNPAPMPALNEERASVEKNLTTNLDKISISDQASKQEIPVNNLRHHKLPNELSHYSVVIARDYNRKPQQEPIVLEEKSSLSANIQFNTLSDGDTDSEIKVNTNQRANKSSTSDDVNKFAPTSSGVVSFPNLDDGLSDEVESCDDGAEDDDEDDDDEQAMEADVEDGDLDDDIDGLIKTTIDYRGGPQTSMSQFARSQQSSSKQQSKLIGGLNDFDAQTKSYSNYMDHETLDQNDIKSHGASSSNYASQNGQSNCFLNSPNQQATVTQPSSSGQYAMQQKGLGNSGSMTRSINLMGRDDVKATNRLSSDTDNETDRLLGTQRNDLMQKMNNNDPASGSLEHQSSHGFKQDTNSREVLIEGVLFNVKYLGSTHTECEGRGEKEDRINQAEMAVHEVKFRNGDTSTPIEVQLFISTEKIMVLDDKHRKIMMDHSLRTISYIADIGDAIVLIVRKKGNNMDVTSDMTRTIPKTTCHVFESHESHTITKSISQAFQVAYTELLKANGADAGSYLPKEIDYQEVLNSQEMSLTELEMFARKDNEREVIVPKQKGEILGISIVESGWGSVLPTAVIASLKQDGPAYRCKKLSVGDQILSINGISLVGLSQVQCQEILRKTHDQRVARLSVVPCPITVEVKIKRPDTKYQLGFSVQNGVICSLLRGGIAERGGVRVGHRIMSINGTTVVDVPHDKIVTLLASSVGEIRMKTCLTSLYRHMLGEEKTAVFL